MQLFGSGPILNEALRAQRSWRRITDPGGRVERDQLQRVAPRALAVERWNRLHPAEPAHQPYIAQALEGAAGPIVAATDYMKIVPDQIAPWLRGGWIRSAPMDSAAATIASICGGISRSMRNPSRRRRFRGWRGRAVSGGARHGGVRRTWREYGEGRRSARVIQATAADRPGGLSYPVLLFSAGKAEALRLVLS